MKHRKASMRLWAVCLLLLLAAIPALAQSGGGYQVARSGYQVARSGYDLTWSTVDGGGWTFSTGEGYSLGGTAGQPDAGVLAGGGYALAGGFWRGGAPAAYRVYLPLVVRN